MVTMGSSPKFPGVTKAHRCFGMPRNEGNFRDGWIFKGKVADSPESHSL